MADEEQVKEPAAKKSSNRIIIVAICVAMLVTGGFFGLKMRTPAGGKKAPEIKLGDIVPIKEFLVNLQDPSGNTQIYLRTELNLQLVKGYKKEDIDTYLAPIQDAIN